jgi:predicted ArsR family transcriptional regulator
VKEETVELLRTLCSKERSRLTALLMKGVRHPADLGSRLGVSRQSVDRHLQYLHRWGIVERMVSSPPMGRPRVEYRVTSEALELMDSLDDLVLEYRERTLVAYRGKVRDLDVKLASGELDEDSYLVRLRELQRRYAAFLMEH